MLVKHVNMNKISQKNQLSTANTESSERSAIEFQKKLNQKKAVKQQRGRPKLSEGEAKLRISLMIDPDVLDYHRSRGRGYQTLFNAVLNETLPGKELHKFSEELRERIKNQK